MVGTIATVGLVALTVTGTGFEVVEGAVEDTLVMERVDVVVFRATMLMAELLPKGAMGVDRAMLVAPQAPLDGAFVPVMVTVLVVVEVMVVVRLVDELVERLVEDGLVTPLVGETRVPEEDGVMVPDEEEEEEEEDDPVLVLMVLVEVVRALVEVLVELLVLVLSRVLSSSGHSRGLPLLGMQPTPVDEQLAVEGQVSRDC